MNEETLAVAASSSPAQAAPGLSSPAHGGSANLDTSVNNSSKIFDNLEEILIELNNFEKEISKAASLLDLTIPSTLESYLQLVANAGSAQFPWTKVKPLFRVKLEQVINEFNSSSPTAEIPPMPNVDPFNFDTVKEKVFDQLEAFVGIPFTVQRLAELLTAPKKHYRRTDKFMRALEKNMLVVSTVEARAVAAAAAAAGNDSVTHNSMVNGSDHNVLPMASSHNMRRAQSPTSSGFVKASKLLENREKEAEAKVNGGEDDSMDEDEKTSNDDGKLSTESDSSEQSSSAHTNAATKNPDSSEMDEASEGCEANARVSEDGDKDKMDVEVNESNSVPSTSEDNAPATPEKVDNAAATAATSTSSPSSDPSTAAVAAASPVTVGDNASSSSDVTQESVEDSSQNESSEEKPIETPVGTTTEEDGNGCETQNIKPDEGEAVADDGGPCDSADSNATSAVSSAPAASETSTPPATSTPTATTAEVGSSEPQDMATCAASSSETKDQSESTATEGAPLAADVSSDTDPHATSSKVEDSDNSMEVDAECTSSENQIHTSST